MSLEIVTNEAGSNDDDIVKALGDIADHLTTFGNEDIPEDHLTPLIQLLRANETLANTVVNNVETDLHDVQDDVETFVDESEPPLKKIKLGDDAEDLIISKQVEPLKSVKDALLHLLRNVIETNDNYVQFSYDWNNTEIIGHDSLEDLVKIVKGQTDEDTSFLIWGGRHSFYVAARNLLSTPDEMKRNFRKMFVALLKNDKPLVNVINEHLGFGKDQYYQKNLVKFEHKARWDQSGVVDHTKLAAIVINGESGSGKSAMMRNYFDKSKRAKILINYDHKWKDIEEESSARRDKYTKVMKRLFKLAKHANRQSASWKLRCIFFQILSKIHEKLCDDRNTKARLKLDGIIQGLINKSGQDSSTLAIWYGGNDHFIVDDCYVIIDEIGQAPCFARALVDSVRTLASEWTKLSILQLSSHTSSYSTQIRDRI
jgi:hypothetical protein